MSETRREVARSEPILTRVHGATNVEHRRARLWARRVYCDRDAAQGYLDTARTAASGSEFRTIAVVVFVAATLVIGVILEMTASCRVRGLRNQGSQ